MSVKILVTPEELEAIGTQFQNGAEAGRTQITHLHNQLNSLEGKWDGNTKARFFEAFNESKKHMDAYVQLLEDINRDLRDIATRFRTVDGQA